MALPVSFSFQCAKFAHARCGAGPTQRDCGHDICGVCWFQHHELKYVFVGDQPCNVCRSTSYGESKRYAVRCAIAAFLLPMQTAKHVTQVRCTVSVDISFGGVNGLDLNYSVQAINATVTTAVTFTTEA